MTNNDKKKKKKKKKKQYTENQRSSNMNPTNPVKVILGTKDRVVITTNRPYSWSFVTQIFRNS